MNLRTIITFILIFIFSVCILKAASDDLTFDTYHTPEQVLSILESWSSEYSKITELITIGKNAGSKDLTVLQIAAEPKNSVTPDSRPGIFISANIEGAHLIGTEAALMIAEKLLTKYGTDEEITVLLKNKTIYIAPLLNPDAASSFFVKPKFERFSNNFPTDEDLDALNDEDGPDDLNNDGLITKMRVKDPEGQWITDPKESRLMRKARAEKGETGIYKIYSEGKDNDSDGEYNEDPLGGIELYRNFPHDFEYNLIKTGRWPVSAEETIALMKFLFDHNNIAMVLNFSRENTFLNLQQTGKAKASRDKVNVPENMAGFLGVDPETEYTLTELVDIIKGLGITPPGMEVNEDLVAMFLGLGPAVNIDKKDMPFFEAIQKEYKDKLKEAEFEYPEKRAEGVGKGSFVSFCYFQYGVWVFSSDLWKIPEPEKKSEKDELTVEKLKVMSSEDFLALEDVTIEAFLESQGAPPNFSAEMVKKMVETGKVTPEKMAEMIEKMPVKPGTDDDEHPDSYILQWSDKILEGNGFVDWTPYNHQTLGDVEIGGFVPYLKINPPPAEMEKTLTFHSDIYLDLMNRLATLKIKQIKVEPIEDGLYDLTIYFTNSGWFPTSTAQGRRARSAWPITIRLKTGSGQTIFSGRSIETIQFIGGSGDTKKLEWTIRGDKGSEITVTAGSPKIGSVTSTFKLK
ncbi:MAG: M14 family metallopeptidase [bacterium]